ncbi:ATP-binding protein [Donghicola sp. XS_ASV15]|uniref:ATP-binding protein n=1 Tax=Donghicola sp. XS_ASV15 TaxID=3241295 RepID=UPI003511FA01
MIRLLDVWPGFSLMSYNTALSFALASGMCICLYHHKEKASFILGILTAILPVLTLLEDLSLIDIRVDNLLFNTSIFGGYMAPNTATGLLIAAICGVLSTFLGAKRWVRGFIASLGLAVFAIGLTGLATYGANLLAEYLWIAITGMALHTAANMVLIGLAIALASEGIGEAVPHHSKEVLITSGVAIVALLITGAIWKSLLEADRNRTVLNVQHELRFMENLLQNEFENLTEALGRMAHREAQRDTLDPALWQADGENYTSDFQQLPGIALIGPDYRIIGVAPYLPNHPAIGLGREYHPDRTAAMDEAVRTKTSAISKPFTLTNGNKSIVIFSPILREEEFLGLIVSSISINSLLRSWMREDFENFELRISDGNDLVTEVTTTQRLATSMSAAIDITVLNRNWTLEMVPDREFVRKSIQPLSQATLPLGFLITLLFSAIVNRSMTVYHQNLKLRKATHELQNREARLAYMARERELIISSTNEGLIYLDRHQNIRLMNEAAGKLLRVDRDAMVGRRFNALPFFISGSDSHATITDITRYDRNEDVELRLAQDGESPIDLSISAGPIEDRKGHNQGYVIVFYDISERRALEKSQSELMDRLERSNEELAQFAYICSHDLQEPFRMINSFTEMLDKHLTQTNQKDEQTEFYLNFLNDAGTRGIGLIRDLLDYSRVEHELSQLNEVDSNAIVHDIFANFRGTSERKLELTQENLPALPFSKVQLMQLFQNLIGNAIKYAKPEDPIKVHVSCEDEGTYWRFEVKDNGIGIAAKNHAKIFEIFKRLHRRDQVPGTGIGLAICRKIVERHGGTLSIKSELGTGSTFSFTVPKEQGVLS